MKVADYVINFFAQKGIDKVFVVYGAANGDLIDAFTRNDDIDYVAVMHEQAGGFAAEGYAKVKSLPGVAIATSGPGGMNFVTSIGNCFYDSVPCIFITGQINSNFLRPNKDIRQIGFQETDIVSIVEPITKYATMIRSKDSIKYELEKAWHMATEGRHGPVLIDLPMNIQKADINPDELFGFAEFPSQKATVSDLLSQQVDELIRDLAAAKRPVVMVGGGVKSAGGIPIFRKLMNELKIPCYPTWNALDVATSDFPYYCGRIGTYGGGIGRNFGIQNSDLLIAIGSRISGRITGGNIHSFARNAKKYVVDIDLPMLQVHDQQVPFDVNIYSDAKLFMNLLIEKLSEKKTSSTSEFDKSDWLNQCQDWKEKYDPVNDLINENKEFEHVHPYLFFRKLSEHMESDAVLVGDCGGNIVASNHSFKTQFGQLNLTNNGNSPMGFSHSASMGCFFGDPLRQIVCTIGDGGFNMNIQELQTFLNYNIKVKTFIVNNHIYGITKAYQKTNFNGRCEACGPVGYNPPNFIRICEAYGIKTFTINSNTELDEIIQQVLEFDGPVVCDVNCHEHHTYEPRIFGWKTPIEDMYPYLSREEFKKNLYIEPLEDWQNPVYPDVK